MSRKLKYSIICLIGLIVIGFSGVFFSKTEKLKAAPTLSATITDNILKSVTLSYDTANNSGTIPKRFVGLANGTAIQVKWEFSFTNKEYAAGDNFVTAIPEGIEVKQDYTGELSDTAEYKIDSKTRTVTVTFKKNVQSAEYELKLKTRLLYEDETSSMSKEIVFDTPTPTIYELSVFKENLASKMASSYKMYDEEGNETTKKPTKIDYHIEFNRYGADLNVVPKIELKLDNYMLPASKINSKLSIDSLVIKAYPQSMAGEKIGEPSILKVNEDYTYEQTEATERYQTYTLTFKKKLTDVLVVDSTNLLDYSNYDVDTQASAIASLGFFGNIAYTGVNVLNHSTTANARFDLDQPDKRKFIMFGDVSSSKEAKSDENLSDVNIYVNLNNELLKNGTEISLAEYDPYGNLAENRVISGLNQTTMNEFDVSMTKNGEVTLGQMRENQEWEIRTDETAKKVILTYTGPDTTDSKGVKAIIGRSATTGYMSVGYSGITVSARDSNARDYEEKKQIPTNSGDNAIKMADTFVPKKTIKKEITANKIYQKTEKIDIQYGNEGKGIKRDSAQKFVVEAQSLGKNTAKKRLQEGTDYQVKQRADGFEILFTTPTEERIEVSCELVIEPDELVDKPGYNADYLYFTASMHVPNQPIRYTNQKSLSIPAFYFSNKVQMVSKFGANSAYTEARFDGNQPINEVLVVINTQGKTMDSGEITLALNGLGIEILDTKVYEGKSLDSMPTFATLSDVIQSEIKVTDTAYPTFEEQTDTLKISHKKINYPLLVKLTVAKTNYFDISIENGIRFQSSYGDVTNTFGTYPYFLSKFKTTVSFESDPIYKNIGHIKVEIPAMEHAKIKAGTKISFSIDRLRSSLYNQGITVTDSSGKVLENKLDIGGSSTNSMTISTKEEYAKGLLIDIPIIYETSGSKNISNAKAYLGNNEYKSPAQVLIKNSSVNIDVSDTEGGGSLILKDFSLKVMDEKTKVGLAGAEFTLRDKEGKEIKVGPSDANGVIQAGEIVVTDYQIVQTKAPNGYAANSEFLGNGKSFTMSASNTNNVEVPLLKEGTINVHFAYEDDTDLTETGVQTIKITGTEDTVIDITKNAEVKKILENLNVTQADYKFIKFDAGQVSGTETNLTMPRTVEDVYYYYEGLVSMDVSKQLSFERGYILPFQQTLAYQNTEPFLLTVRDNRQFLASQTNGSGTLRGDIRIRAYLSKEFRTRSNSSVLKNIELKYQQNKNTVLLNGEGGEIIQNSQNGDNAQQKDFQFILDDDSSDEGFKLVVEPGQAIANDAYYGEVTWEFEWGP